MEKVKKTKKTIRRCVVLLCENTVVGRGELCGDCRYFLGQKMYNDSQACRNSLRLAVERIARDLVPRTVERMLLGDLLSWRTELDAGLVRRDL